MALRGLLFTIIWIGTETYWDIER